MLATSEIRKFVQALCHVFQPPTCKLDDWSITNFETLEHVVNVCWITSSQWTRHPYLYTFLRQKGNHKSDQARQLQRRWEHQHHIKKRSCSPFFGCHWRDFNGFRGIWDLHHQIMSLHQVYLNYFYIFVMYAIHTYTFVEEFWIKSESLGCKPNIKEN